MAETVRPVNPAVIEVTADAWTSQSSIVVTLAVVEASPTRPATAQGWFDGITLEVAEVEQVDESFSDGFE